MSEHETEIKAKLTLDDHAAEAQKHIVEGFEKIGERVSEVQHEMTGMLKQAVAVAVGFQFDRGIESLKELGGEFIHAAMHAGGERKALAGILAMTDRTGKSFEELTEDAHELHDNLEGMAVNMGVSSETIMDSFEMIASRSNKSTEQVKELTGQIALAGKVAPGGADAIAAAFRDMETGIVRPKNAIVALIKMSHTAGGTQRDIAKGLSNLLETGRSKQAFELAEKAIGKMADKAKNIPVGFGATIQSLKDLREQIFAVVGEPMVKAIAGPLGRLRKYFIENREKIEEYAHTIGEKVGKWMEAAATKIQEGFQYLQSHAEEIQAAIESGVKTAKSVIQFILDHKEAIAIAFGAKALAPSVMGAAQGIGTLATAAGGIGSSGAFGMAAGGGMASAALLAGAAAAAVVAWVGVYDQVTKLSAETGGFKSKTQQNVDATLEGMQKAAMAGNVELVKHWHDMISKESNDIAALSQAQGFEVQAQQVHDQMLKFQESVNASVDGLDVSHATKSAEELIKKFAEASAQHDEARMRYVAGIISGNDMIMAAMNDVGFDFQNAGTQLADAIEKMGRHATAGEIKDAIAAQKKAGDAVSAPQINFNGGQVFHIKQDFRNEDPDRIALVFRKDLARTAAARVQARTTSPFGL